MVLSRCFVYHLVVAALLASCSSAGPAEMRTSRERMCFQTDHGEIHMAFYPDVAPVTVKHIIRLGELGLYTTNHFFRVDKGFVAQVAAVVGGRTAPMNGPQRVAAQEMVPLEVRSDVQHTHRGLLSMARGQDPNSGGSSFSIMLGPAPHLDGQYAVFGHVTMGLEVLAKFEKVETKKEGIFVMPVKRINILATYMYLADGPLGSREGHLQCTELISSLQRRYDAQAVQMQRDRQRLLPGKLKF